MHVCGCIYIIFFIEEVPKPETVSSESKDGVDNAGFDSNDQNIEMRPKNVSNIESASKTQEATKNIIREGLDLFISNFKVFQIPRPFSARKILLIVIIGYILMTLATGEFEIFILFGRESWGWTTEFAFYQSYTTFIAFIGTLIVTGLLVEVWKIADPILVMISLACSIIAKPILAITKDFYTIYIATTVEMFNSTRVIAMRSLISKIVGADELGRVYSVMSVIDTVVSPLSVLMYNQVYKETISTFPGTFYFLTVGLFTIIFIIYL